MIKTTPIVVLLVLIMLFTACKPNETSTVSPVTEFTKSVQKAETAPTNTAALTPNPNLLPPEAQDLTFQTPQGRTLQGRYFPAEVENAPLVILIHWVTTNQDSWKNFAYWLQNRIEFFNLFPSLGERSYAVFTFTLSGCESWHGCGAWTGPEWAEDANAAILFASQLPGIDPARIVTAGASIGADAAIDSCTWFTQQGGPAHCVGALSFSPGNYLGLDYAEQVTLLEVIPVPAWCFYAVGDSDADLACTSASGSNYLKYEYAGELHGIQLLAPEVTPKEPNKTTLELFLEFLDSVFK